MAQLQFTKMEALGNDYVYMEDWENKITDPHSLSREIADRHRGIGSDGLILFLKAEREGAHARMRMFNADGSEVSVLIIPSNS